MEFYFKSGCGFALLSRLINIFHSGHNNLAKFLRVLKENVSFNLSHFMGLSVIESTFLLFYCVTYSIVSDKPECSQPLIR